MSLLTCAEIIDRFPTELASIITAMSDVPAVASAGTVEPGEGYLVTIVAAEGGEGVLKIHFEHDGAGQLARRVLATPDAPSDHGVTEALRDICGRAATTVVDRRRLGRVRVRVESVEALSDPPAGTEPILAVITCEGDEPVTLAMWGTLALGDGTQSPLPGVTRSTGHVGASPDSPD